MIAVIGAGLVGCAAALAFAEKGYEVVVYESRADLRTTDEHTLRSINLAVSSRGIAALRSINLEMSKRVLKNLIPMYGRMIHDESGNQQSQRYSIYGESINSINRTGLNSQLLDEVEAKGIKIEFNAKLVGGDLDTGKLVFADGTERTYGFIIGCDGAYSKVRQMIMRSTAVNYSQEYIDHYYLELVVPPTTKLDKNHLHIWPRHEFMLIALANPDGSFTSTLFAPKAKFDDLGKNTDKFLAFFEHNFPDALELMGRDMVKQCFEHNPRGSLVYIKTKPYHYNDRAIILGDASHSMVPFYGQGMNCGFEDVRVLMEILDRRTSMQGAFEEYTETRHKDLTSIVDLSLRNYQEMSHDVVSPIYIIHKTVDDLLYRLIPRWWVPLYSMVSFRADIRYSDAVKRNNRQVKILKVAGTLGLVLALSGIYRKYK